MKRRSLLSVLLTAFILTGCGKTADEPMVVVDNSPEEALYALIPVTREDVVLTRSLNVTWVQDQEQEVSFPVGGKRVTKVYVHQGDVVKPGDLLIELSASDLGGEIDALEYRIQKNKLQLGYLDAAEAFDRDDAYNSFVYNTPEIKDEDVEKYENNESSIAENYRYQREDLNDEIEFDQKKLARLKSELAASRIYSTMSGTVYTIAANLEGSTSRKDEVVMTIVDGSSGHFEMHEPDAVSYFHEGETIPLNIYYTNASGSYEVLPLHMDQWDEIQQFSVFSGPDNDGIDVGTSASIIITLDRHERVLSLPLGAVHRADGKPYVYVLDDNGFRQIKWIETGLAGDDRIEILKGLEEGDQVVKQ
ncbi:MAG: efflux RND transporter periplasmic adaptor subunit [Lachnospiraceae bacterium]|nr:efflux RND transporter periplasmic adaptor subunit [Lachnospiraceae bacterium]